MKMLIAIFCLVSSSLTVFAADKAVKLNLNLGQVAGTAADKAELESMMSRLFAGEKVSCTNMVSVQTEGANSKAIAGFCKFASASQPMWACEDMNSRNAGIEDLDKNLASHGLRLANLLLTMCSPIH